MRRRRVARAQDQAGDVCAASASDVPLAASATTAQAEVGSRYHLDDLPDLECESEPDQVPAAQEDIAACDEDIDGSDEEDNGEMLNQIMQDLLQQHESEEDAKPAIQKKARVIRVKEEKETRGKVANAKSKQWPSEMLQNSCIDVSEAEVDEKMKSHGPSSDLQEASSGSGILRCAHCKKTLDEVGKDEWSDTIADACFVCATFFGCYPDKNVSWPKWAAGESRRSAQSEREAACSVLQKLLPSRKDITKEQVLGEKFNGYFVQDHFNLYTPEDFVAEKGMEGTTAGVMPNIKLCDPNSEQEKDFIMVRQNKPLQLIQVTQAGTKLTSDLMPYLIRPGQGVAQY